MERIIIKTIENILQTNHVPIRKITLPDDNIADLDLGLRKNILGISDIVSMLNHGFSTLQENHIYFMTDIFQCNYVTLAFPDSKEWFIAGPLLYEQITEEHFQNLFSSLKLPVEFQESLKNYYEHLVFLPSRLFLESLFQEMGNTLYGKDNFTIDYTDGAALDLWYLRYNNYLRTPDEPFLNIQIMESRYEIENALITAVSNGNESAALESLKEFYSQILPQRLPDQLRDMKDYSITLNTLLRKATEHAGVHPIHIDCYSNSNIPLIEQLTDPDQFYSFWEKMVREYCDLIHKHSLLNYYPIIGKVLTYITTDLRADLSLNELSRQLSVNASYLSALFKKEMGTTLTDYVNSSRITLAQNLLLSTDLPIKSVAQHCGIPDVYYFTRLFKRITGTTPKAFRENTPHEARIGLSKLQGPAKSPSV